MIVLRLVGQANATLREVVPVAELQSTEIVGQVQGAVQGFTFSHQ